jgi:hypothetical protein
MSYYHHQENKVMSVSVEKFLGLPKKDAQNLAERQNLIFRLISVDGEPFLPYPEDTRDDRICVEIEKNKVAKVTVR